ncbi:recombinase family protein (plasmid) [Bacillus cytotoxicus]|uniref:recombinase family protein n=1 Tax=Bacillus cereus group TaxID=86661 RepID=UPI000B35284E|nr:MULTISPECIES: recombinase family protein [Bacillus cereus group]MDH2882456.1 recombinase family protein [Bacillus cytotoxicus]QTR81135.1 recombinase family protein [Bacillus cytotoxicus]QTR87908.1 recombinase family protein [Bacillus cytotoxicus]HDR4573318.1 recombinase family protein [Bacillus cytotoxicus]HDR4589350.1 recombinase family protein [Bacillus cytotoxicus]
MVKAAIYIRVSTQEQVENYSIEVQRERIKAYCKAKNWDIYDEYIDGGYSGANLNRPDIQRLLKDLKNIDVVVVFKLDRLSRSQKDTLELIEEHFLKNNVDFVSITETLDTSTPFGKAMIGILSVFAQLERETIAERMRMGHIKRAENGLRGMGGDYDPTGYLRHNGRLIIKEDEAMHIKRAYDLYEQYLSITRVQEKLKEEGYQVWRFRRYRDILSNTLYIGNVTFARKTYKGQHEPIISPEQFKRVQDLLKRHKGHNAHKTKQSLLSGLITCSCCGEKFVAYSTGKSTDVKSKRYYYYICRAKRFPAEYEKKCMNKTWSRKKLEDIIINGIKDLTFKRKTTKKKENKINYDRRIKEIDKQMERLLVLFTTNTNTSRQLLEQQMEKFNLEKENLILKKEQSEQEVPLLDKTIDKAIKVFDTLEFKDKQVLVNKFVKEIYIDHENVDIIWRF